MAQLLMQTEEVEKLLQDLSTKIIDEARANLYRLDYDYYNHTITKPFIKTNLY